MGDYIDTEKGISTGTVSWRRTSDTSIPSRSKITGSYVNPAFSKTEAMLNGFDEAIVLTADGHVSEGSAENLFMVRDGVLDHAARSATTSSKGSLGPASSRSPSTSDIPVKERSIDRTELYIADEVFLCGTGAQVSPVVVGRSPTRRRRARRADLAGRSARPTSTRCGDAFEPSGTGSRRSTRVSEAAARDSSAPQARRRRRGTGAGRPGGQLSHRLLEIVPGLLTWSLILSLIPLSLRWPQVLGVFVLSFDFYWLYRAVVLSVSVAISFRRIRRVVAVDWRQRAFSLADPQRRLDELAGLIERVPRANGRAAAAGNKLAAAGGRRELRRLVDEQRKPGTAGRPGRADPGSARALARGPDPDVHRALREALPDRQGSGRLGLPARHADGRDHHPRDGPAGPRERGQAARDLRRRSSATSSTSSIRSSRAWSSASRAPWPTAADGCTASWLAWASTRRRSWSRTWTRTTASTRQYFGYLTYKFLTDRDRYRRLYQPVPMFHNNLWQCPLPGQAGRRQFHARPDVAPPHAGAAGQLQLVRGLACRPSTTWTTGPPTRSPRTAASTGRASSATAASSGPSPSSSPCTATPCGRGPIRGASCQQYTQIRRWAWGVTDIPFFIDNALQPLRDPAAGASRPPVRPVGGSHQLGRGAVHPDVRGGPAGGAEPDLRADASSASSCRSTPPGF